MRLSVVGLFPLALSLACQGKVESASSSGNDGGGPSSGASSSPAPPQDAGPRAPAPYRITCTFYTRDLSSKTMAARNVDGLYAIGEAVDVTGWLGGYNFQWAWSSGWSAGQSL